MDGAFETKSSGYRIDTKWSGQPRGLAASAVSERTQGSLVLTTVENQASCDG
jgi:hypothetical protein